MPKKTGQKKAAFGADLIEGMKLCPGAQPGRSGSGAGLAKAHRRQGDSEASEDVPSRILSNLRH